MRGPLILFFHIYKPYAVKEELPYLGTAFTIFAAFPHPLPFPASCGLPHANSQLSILFPNGYSPRKRLMQCLSGTPWKSSKSSLNTGRCSNALSSGGFLR